jgi:hypothetical protein
MKSLIEIAAKAAASQCGKGIFLTCLGLIDHLPIHLNKQVYRYVSLSDDETEMVLDLIKYRVQLLRN